MFVQTRTIRRHIPNVLRLLAVAGARKWGMNDPQTLFQIMGLPWLLVGASRHSSYLQALQVVFSYGLMGKLITGLS